MAEAPQYNLNLSPEYGEGTPFEHDNVIDLHSSTLPRNTIDHTVVTLQPETVSEQETSIVFIRNCGATVTWARQTESQENEAV